MRPASPRSAGPVLAAGAVCAAVVMATVGACSSRRDPGPVRALDPTAQSGEAPQHRTGRTDPPTPSAAPRPGSDGDIDQGPSTPRSDDDEHGVDGARRTVTAVLGAYDRALTDLAAQPEMLHDLGSPHRRAWDLVVDPLSTLHRELIDRIDRHLQVDRQRIVPGPDGLSFEHHVTDASRHDDSIEFRWCGYSPGVAVDIDSGAVRDDDVAISRGTGRLTRSDDTWILSSLLRSEVTIHDRATPDPCGSTP